MKKTLIITGGSKGIGRSIAIKFAKNNFDIFTCSRNQDELNKLESEIKSINPKIKVSALVSDLSTKEGSLNFIDFVIKNTNKIDVLVNNVGTFIPGKLIEEEDSALEQMININLYSNYWVTKGLVNLMTNKKLIFTYTNHFRFINGLNTSFNYSYGLKTIFT